MISIILPVFNSEKFLRQCLKSIFSQTFQDWELIAVDDGSTDSSLEILQEIKDDRLKILSQSNLGPGYARNLGLENALGEYLFFIDSDDRLEKSLIGDLYNFMIRNNCDVVQSAICFETGKYGLIPKIYKEYGSSGIISRDEAMFELINQKLIKNFSWGKLYRKDLIKGLRFPDRLVYEDFFWSEQIINRCTKYGYVNDTLYYYRQHPDSLTGTLNHIDPKFLAVQKERLIFIKKNYPSFYKKMKKKYDGYEAMVSREKNLWRTISQSIKKIKEWIFYPYERIEIIY